MKREIEEIALSVRGFRFGAAACGIKASRAADVALLVADRPATAAAIFTRNRFRAAPVEVSTERVRGGRLQALVVNSGNANACTGPKGLRDARRATEIAGSALGVDPRFVAPASTGVIGVPLPMVKLEAGIRAAAASADEAGLWRFARAIMTSDQYPKVARETVVLGRRRVTIAAVGKGAGMIAPDMATLLVFLVTDADVERRVARGLLREACGGSLNALTVDGDTSTNDSVYLLASGAAQNPIVMDGAARRTLARALGEVTLEIARLVAADGEGATKLVAIEVVGASTDADARKVARSVADSPLVKTAFYGADPNWGRIAMAIGKAGVAFDPGRVEIRIGPAVVFRRGAAVGRTVEQARKAMRGAEFSVRIDLGGGSGRASVLTGDLSAEYVRFNSAYTT